MKWSERYTGVKRAEGKVKWIVKDGRDRLGNKMRRGKLFMIRGGVGALMGEGQIRGMGWNIQGEGSVVSDRGR